MNQFLGAVLILLSLFFLKDLPSDNLLVAASSETINPLPASQPILTESRFEEKLEEEIEKIPKKTVYQDDPSIAAGIDKVLDGGMDGKKTKIFKITYYKPNTSEVGFDSSEVAQEEYSKEIISTETIPAVDKKILRGTKIVWKTLNTPEGQIQYWKKMRVYATHYDQHCKGCDEWTAIGMRAGKGVIAVDPKVIKLRSKVYIPEYGMAVAGDTGGAIKGNIIDLGFEDAKTAGWSARFVDIYLL